ncbi:MAG TPA: hypothetical protein VMG34_00020, partial [Bacteroidota bacterium]|nr:hypothetical protein [Bacteroidota bacterium]
TLDPSTPLWFDVPWDLRQDNGRFLHHDLPCQVVNEPVKYNGGVYLIGRSFYRIYSQQIHVRVFVQVFPASTTFSSDQDLPLVIKGGVVYVQP